MPDEKPDIHTIRFFALVDSFAHAAMVFLGKIADPITGKQEPDIEKARIYIDFLATIEARTRGNLLRAESDHLEHLLANLRLNYVDVLDAGKKDAEKPAEPGPESAGTPGSAEPGGES